jgi:hypothetical protein
LPASATISRTAILLPAFKNVVYTLTPPSVATFLNRAKIQMRCTRRTRGGAASVSILLAPGWRFAKVFRYDCEMPTAGCLGAEITDGSCTMFVASVKLPPGLDSSCSRWTTCPTQRTSRRLLQRVLEWARPYPLAFICGDFNTTASCCLDRGNPCPSGCSGVRPGNVVTDVMTSHDSQMCDVFREIHPTVPGHTRGDARLDYIFAPRSLVVPASLTCTVLDDFPSDHRPLSVQAHFHGSSTPRKQPHWAAPRAVLDRASPAQKASFALEVESTVLKLLDDWGTSPCTAPILLTRQTALAEAIVKCARTHLPFSDTPRAHARRPRPRRRLRARVLALECAVRLAAVMEHKTYLIRCPRFLSARQRLQDLSLEPAIDTSDVRAWVCWAADDGAQALRSARDALCAANQADPHRGDRGLSENLWKRSRSRRNFFAKYFRSSSSAEITSAAVPGSSHRTFDAKECKEIVAKTVARPFSQRVPLNTPGAPESPGPCSGACKCTCVGCPADGSKAPISPPQTCADIRCRGPNSLWGTMYSPHAEVCSSQTGHEFADVLRAPSPAEIAASIAKCDGGKASGHDGLSIDLLRLASNIELIETGRSLAEPARTLPSATSPTAPASTATALSRLSSWAFLLGVQTEHVTRGLIRMIPKGPATGQPDVSDMRPITLLSEIGKVPSRILASRVTSALNAKPELLHAAQRAFLSNGDVSQCIHTALDVFEDFNSIKRKAGGVLHLISYDVQKAFDSVQEDSIRATLTRYRFPALAIDYICSSLVGAKSSVITAHGPTEPFQVLSSVRQGDPLAPLIYILFLDVLHRGLDCNPTGPVALSGYTMSTGDRTRVASCGYADDLLSFSESPAAAERMHDWTRQFFGMHATKVNAIKTKYFCSSRSPDLPVSTVPATNGSRHGTPTCPTRRPPSGHVRLADLRSVCGRSRVPARPTSSSFRYLGVLISPDLLWADELQRLNGIVWHARTTILNHRMRLLPAVDAIRSFVVPRMEAGLQCIRLTAATVKKLDHWTGLLQSAVLLAQASKDNKVCRAGFCMVTDMPDLALTARALRTSALYQRLCLSSHALPHTSADRVAAVSLAGSLESALSDVHRPCSQSSAHWNRAADCLWGSYRLPLHLNWNADRSDPSLPLRCVPVPSAESALEEVNSYWNPRLPPHTLFSTTSPRNYDIYTDGSTPVEGGGVSGYAAVVFDRDLNALDPRTLHPAVLGSYLKCSGNNFLAEMCALVAALLSVPAQSDVRLFSDSLGCIQAVHRDDTAEKRRIRAAARPMLTTLRRLLASRAGRVSFHHVRAHTKGKDFHSVANGMADEAANAEREAAAAVNVYGTPFLYNEERVIAFLAWPGDKRAIHIIGDVGAACRGWARRELFHRWCSPDLARQGQTPRSSTFSEVALLCKISRGRLDSDLVYDLLLALCQWVPCGRTLGRWASAPARSTQAEQWACPSCAAPGDESCSHVLLCNSAEPLRWNLAWRVDEIISEGLIIPDRFSMTRERLVVAAHACARRLASPSHLWGPAVRRLLVAASRLSYPSDGYASRPCELAKFAVRAYHLAKCPCGVVGRSDHVLCSVPVSAPVTEVLRRSLGLDTCLFTSPRELPAGFEYWTSFNAPDLDTGSLGNPWLTPWTARRSLCAPWSTDDCTWSRCLSRAKAATLSARPTRLALVLPHAAHTRASNLGAVRLCALLPGSLDRSLYLVQNMAAAGLFPVDWSALAAARCLDAGFVAPSFTPQVPLAPRANPSWPAPAFADSSFLPFLNASTVSRPLDLPESLDRAFENLRTHDRYTGLIGLLPPRFESLLEWLFKRAGCNSREASRLAKERAATIRLQLLFNARRTFHAAHRVSWSSLLDGPKMPSLPRRMRGTGKLAMPSSRSRSPLPAPVRPLTPSAIVCVLPSALPGSRTSCACTPGGPLAPARRTLCDHSSSPHLLTLGLGAAASAPLLALDPMMMDRMCFCLRNVVRLRVSVVVTDQLPSPRLDAVPTGS